uniref:Uncharacterized protein n=1 Tax=Hemiselmis andersenii TaxID=464988 RepID=A0A6U2D9A7_HEMAN|mmetsp:Transcript_23173/g.53805  ORF Transcript_23173/g.53805 Transcript_23173/m.53805 type:complete len:248 (-) Transcript_23173:269-1012(-)
MSRNWRLVEAVERNNLWQVYEQLREGANVELHYIGVTPLQMAIESYNPDIAALLLHWKADPEKHTASRAAGAMYASGETSKELVERLIKKTQNPTKAAALKHIKKMMESPEALKEHCDKMQEKIVQLEQEYAKTKMTTTFRWGMAGLMLTVTFVCIHFVLIFAPEFTAQTFSQKFLNDVYIYSPYFLGHNPFVAPVPPTPGDYSHCRVLEDRQTVLPLRNGVAYQYKEPKVSWLSGEATKKHDDEEL